MKQPTMWITRDSNTMRAEGWRQDDIVETQSTMLSVYRRLPGDGYFVSVPGMFHPNFSDAPLISPLASLIGLTGPIDGRRGQDIVNAYTLAFFDRELKGAAAQLLDGPAKQYREVRFSARRS